MLTMQILVPAPYLAQLIICHDEDEEGDAHKQVQNVQWPGAPYNVEEGHVGDQQSHTSLKKQCKIEHVVSETLHRVEAHQTFIRPCANYCKNAPAAKGIGGRSLLQAQARVQKLQLGTASWAQRTLLTWFMMVSLRVLQMRRSAQRATSTPQK